MAKCSPEFLRLADDCRNQFAQTSDGQHSSILSSDDMEEFQTLHPGRVRNYPALKTLALFMGQVVNDDKSCSKVLIQDAADQQALGQKELKTETDAYCKSRKRLHEAPIKSLLQTSGGRLSDQCPAEWLWHNRRVVLTDGSTVLGPDTEDNQKEYPQPSTQKKGLGFPIMRILVLITLANGALLDVAVAPCSGKETGEQALLRQMFENLNEGDILLGDANFENYFLLAALMAANIDGVFEKNGSRIIDFRKCHKKLGSKDGLFRLDRPVRPPWMDEETYRLVPKDIIVRAIKTKKRMIVTTLTDAELYPRKDISDLYIDRWHVEVDFRCIKTVMGMEILRCKTPEMLRKELYVHLLMYNLIRALMAETAKAINHQPRKLSFKTAKNTLLSYHYLLLIEAISIFLTLEKMMRIIGKHKVGNRPGRAEPRAVKRRGKPTKKLQHPRKQARRLTQYKG